MAVQRPPKDANPAAGLPDIKLVDDLVKKSLEVNPQLRGGKSTHEFLRGLRQQALAESSGKPAAPSPASAAPPKALGDRRQQTVNIFLSQKADDVERELGALREQVRAIEAQQKAVCARAIDEIVDLLVVVISSGASGEECQSTLRNFRPLLSQLGVGDVDLLRLAKKR